MVQQAYVFECLVTSRECFLGRRYSLVRTGLSLVESPWPPSLCQLPEDRDIKTLAIATMIYFSSSLNDGCVLTL